MSFCPKCRCHRGPWDEACSECGFSYKESDAQKSAAGTKAADIAAGCPACGAARPPDELFCPACGVVYEKCKPRAPKAAEVVRLLDANAHKERPHMLSLMMLATILINGFAAILLFMVPIPGLSSPYLILASAATAVCAAWVLRWRRWAVNGLYLLQISGIAVLLLGSAPLWTLVQPVVVLTAFHYLIDPIRYQFE